MSNPALRPSSSMSPDANQSLTVTFCRAFGAGAVLFGAPASGGAMPEKVPAGEVRMINTGSATTVTRGFSFGVANSNVAYRIFENERADELRQDPLVRLEGLIPSLASDAIRRQARTLCDGLRRELAKRELPVLPPLIAVEEETGACVIEWSIDGQRIGFGLELEESQSGWFLVSSRESGRASAYGNMGTEDLKSLLDRLLRKTSA